MKASLFQVETQHCSTEKAQVLESVGLGIKIQLHICLLNTKLLMPNSFLYKMRIGMHYLEEWIVEGYIKERIVYKVCRSTTQLVAM